MKTTLSNKKITFVLIFLLIFLILGNLPYLNVFFMRHLGFFFVFLLLFTLLPFSSTLFLFISVLLLLLTALLIFLGFGFYAETLGVAIYLLLWLGFILKASELFRNQ